MAATTGPRNVLGGPLEECGQDPLTGFYRDGCCRTGPEDLGNHTVCAVVTAEFLEVSLRRGNDLVTPRPGFAGLRPGDPWCLCAARWAEARDAGHAPPVRLAATAEQALSVVPLADLRRHAVDVPDHLGPGDLGPGDLGPGHRGPGRSGPDPAD